MGERRGRTAQGATVDQAGGVGWCIYCAGEKEGG